MRATLILGTILIGVSLLWAQETTTSHQQPYRLVEVEGQAVISNGNEVAARDAARADAVRKAIEQVVGVYVSSESLTRNFELIRDEIYARANGFAVIEKILQEGAQGGIYRTKAQVKVYLVQNDEGKQALAEKLRDLGLLRQLRIMVVIPEEHRREQRPVPIPDPAAETAIMRALVRTGFKTVDKEFVKQIRDSRVVKELMRGNIDQRQLYDLRQRYGADVVVVGEAFSQRVPPPSVVGDTNFIFCRARVEIKAILTETGEIISADAEHGSGRDLAEELASKMSLEQTAATLAPRLINDLLVGGYGGAGRATANVEVEISGWRKLSDAQRFLDALEKVRGIRRVHMSEFKGGVLFAEVEIDQNLKKRLAQIIEELPGFEIEVESASGSKIEGVVKKASNQSSNQKRR
jgi:hypothetical protein